MKQAIRIQKELEKISKEYKIPHEKLTNLIDRILKIFKENK